MSIVIRPLSTYPEFCPFVELEQRVWTGVPPMRADILLIAHRNGGLVLGAFDVAVDGSEQMVGLLFGYVGRRRTADSGIGRTWWEWTRRTGTGTLAIA